MKIKLLLWNILYKENIRNILKLIKELEPDIVCLQELTIDSKYNLNIPNTPEFIAKELDVNYYFEVAHINENSHEFGKLGNGIFSKYPIIRKSHFFTQKPSIGKVSYMDEGRVYLEADINIDGSVLTIGTTHLSYVDRFLVTDQKRLEVDNLVKGIKDKKENFIFMGDLNSLPDSYSVSELNKYFISCGPDYNENTWTTKPFDYLGFKEDKLNWRLDYVFATKDIKVLSSEVIKTDYSDHLPILTTIKL